LQLLLLLGKDSLGVIKIEPEEVWPIKERSIIGSRELVRSQDSLVDTWIGGGFLSLQFYVDGIQN